MAAAADGERPKTYTDKDGTVMEWDEARRGYFPKIDEVFLAQYQLNYGTSSVWTAHQDDQGYTYYFNNQTGESQWTAPPGFIPGAAGAASATAAAATAAPTALEEEQMRQMMMPPPEYDDEDDDDDATEMGAGNKRKKEKAGGPAAKKPKVPQKNSTVYVQGLPTEDFDEAEFAKFMARCGLIAIDEDGNPKVKLYRNDDGSLKGDARCRYLKPESVSLCLTLLDGSDIRPGFTVKIEEAVFQPTAPRDETPVDPEEAKRRKRERQNKKKAAANAQKKLDKMLGWHEEKGEKSKKAQGVMVLKNVFTPALVDNDPTILNDIKEDMMSEAAKFGVVKKVIIFDRHPEGVVSVKFETEEAAMACSERFNGRMYNGRRLEAAMWDGHTNYKIEESEMEREDRLKKWDEFLGTE